MRARNCAASSNGWKQPEEVKLMFCYRTRKHLIPYLEGTLDGRKSEAVAKHLARCKDCTQELAAIERATSIFRDIKPEAQDPSENLWARVEREIAGTVPLERRWHVRGLQLGGVAAAAAILLLAIVDVPRMRDGAVTLPPAPNLNVNTDFESQESEGLARSRPNAKPSGIPKKIVLASPEPAKSPSAPASPGSFIRPAPPVTGQTTSPKNESGDLGTLNKDKTAEAPLSSKFQKPDDLMAEATVPDHLEVADGDNPNRSYFGADAGVSSGHPGPAGPRGATTTAAAVGDRLDPGKMLRVWRNEMEAKPDEKHTKVLAAAESAGLIDDLEKWYESEASRRREPAPRLILAGIYEHRGNIEKAVEVRRDLSRLYPDNLSNWIALGDGLARTGEKAKAKDAYLHVTRAQDSKLRSIAEQRLKSLSK